jgi:hypothetical protein
MAVPFPDPLQLLGFLGPPLVAILGIALLVKVVPALLCRRRRDHVRTERPEQPLVLRRRVHDQPQLLRVRINQ